MSPLMQSHTLFRARIAWLAVALVAIASGLASRKFGGSLPPFVATYAGDTLWATVVYAIAGLVAPGSRIRTRAVASLAFASAIECSQLLRADWLESIRATTVGALVLGRGFLWFDLACYAAGVALAALCEAFVRSARGKRKN
jgi:hypothetical protein